ncbi:hypothetical protein J2X07_003733 [Fictibacillus barbaricus]|uniref:Uncharacterized protein n=1 Tax=Fictibacillus barbaricus TaxID=182136 RepID=A0ABU1U5T2_9BACL|nr:hypothetical protein [Fictibacillus barbaricus]
MYITLIERIIIIHNYDLNELPFENKDVLFLEIGGGGTPYSKHMESVYSPSFQ